MKRIPGNCRKHKHKDKNYEVQGNSLADCQDLLSFKAVCDVSDDPDWEDNEDSDDTVITANNLVEFLD